MNDNTVKTDRERRRLQVEWTAMDAQFPVDGLTHEFFEGQAARTPARVAVKAGASSLTYGELEMRANRIAQAVRARGIGRGERVGLCVERGIEMLAALLGILKAGAAYVPLDPSFPQERLRFMAQDAELALLVSTANLAQHFGLAPESRLLLDADCETIAAAPTVRLPVDARSARSEDPAYVIYTSGSTGKPKGVVVPHRAVVNFLTSMAREPGLTEDDVLLAVTTLSFDIAVLELQLPLTVGATVVIASRHQVVDGDALKGLLEAHRATFMQATPMTWRLLLEAGWKGRSGFKALVGGEALPKDVAEQLLEHGVALWNMYGPTETTIWSTCCRVTDAEDIHIGRPIENTEIHILDEQQQPVPVGAAGELLIGGEGLALGYFNRPELTDEKFIAHPFKSGARLYRTGDLARYRLDGNIDCLGRLDFQVKIRGFRIELGEIEETLRRHPSVRDAVVTGFLNEHQEQKLAAHLMADRDLDSSIREHCVKWLPEYMVPDVIVVLDEYPLTPNGKLDRSALRLPEKAPFRRGDQDPPRDELERWLHENWVAILRREDFGIHVGFFNAGGSSLLAGRLVQRLRQRLGEFIFVTTIFDAPTIAEYADLLKRQYPDRVRELFPGINSSGNDGARRVANALVLTDAEIGRFQDRVPVFRSRGRDSTSPLNPPAVFMLAPPRSGTTLLRVMLAGHPGLFATSELQLLQFATLRSRREAFQGKFETWLEGTVRVLMELHGVDADTAKILMEEYESKDLTTLEFYRLLQDAIGDRLLLDKTPSYALDPVALEHAELDFEQARFIHLVRHPQAVVRSFERMHMDQVLVLKDHPYNARQLGELVWLRSHCNILELLAKVPEERQCHLRYEDLVANPRGAMERICAMLNLPFVGEMLEPYRNKESKMTTGLYPESTPMGDVRFLTFSEIRPDVADSWRAASAEFDLAPATWNLARELGYEPADADRGGLDRNSIRSRRNQSAMRQRRLHHRVGKA